MARRLPFLLLLAAWPLFLALQQGDDFDESEHCHVAWMIGRMHEQPMRDFFQHHQPLLWDLLKTYYLAGGDGPEVLYFGRALVVGCALLFALGAYLLARNWTRGQTGAASPGWFGVVLGVAPVLLMSLALRQSLVIRPETIGLPFVALALACWTYPTRARWATLVRGFLAGVLFGAALYASPRFAVLAGAFLLLPADRRQLFSLEIGPLAVAVAGAVLFVFGYHFLMGGRVADLWFNVEFSSITYKTAAAAVRPPIRLLVFTGELILVAGWVFLRLDGLGRRRFLVQAVYLLLTTAAALSSAWPLLYPQNFIAPVILMSVMFACAAGRMETVRMPARRSWAPRWALVVAGVGLLLMLHDVVVRESIVARVQHKHDMLALLRPGERVLLAAAFHPICALDATYYINPIVDDDDHWGKAVAVAQRRHWALPDCDYLGDVLAQKPVLVDDYLIRAMPEADRARYRAVLDREYTEATPFSSSHHCYRRTVNP
ncbi:MAG TPA: hypothetical protein VMS17_13720 [Gemmataceae bacterium]|nr:hypothetical protein [Gemmataceae bacterium]